MARVAFGAVVVVSLLVLFTPAYGVPSAPPGVDKVVHAVLFAGLAVTGRWAGSHRRPLAVSLVGYAAVSEVIQEVSGLGRSGTVADLLADAIGVLVGLLLWDRRRARDRRR